MDALFACMTRLTARLERLARQRLAAPRECRYSRRMISATALLLATALSGLLLAGLLLRLARTN